MKCCPKCFEDKFLSEQVRRGSRESGECSYCKSQGVELISPDTLYDFFGAVLDLYEIDDKGTLVAVRLQEDWKVFSIDDCSIITDLLIAITQDQRYGKDRFGPKNRGDESKLIQWHKFREELMYQNRFFPENIPERENLKELFEYLAVIDRGDSGVLYRARVCISSEPFSVQEMGMPSNEKVSNGRANPVGIPYLYAASNAETALSEVRPAKSDRVAVAEFQVVEDLRLVDLRSPKQSISPFIFDDGDPDLVAIHKDMPFLTLLGDELAKPIVPRTAKLEYLPSQYLCEMVKHMDFDGIVYRSSLSGTGENYAIFDDKKLICQKICQYQIDDIELKFTPID